MRGKKEVGVGRGEEVGEAVRYEYKSAVVCALFLVLLFERASAKKENFAGS